MTYKTLSYIHNLLVNRDYVLSQKVDELRKEFYEAEHLYEQELLSRNELDSAETKYRDVYAEQSELRSALREFEHKEWR